MTKRELEKRVAELEGELARVAPEADVREHLGLLERALAPYLRRLERLPAAEAAVEAAVELDALKAALMRLGAVRLDSREVGAMNNLLRQVAEVRGLLASRRPAAGGRSGAGEVGGSAPKASGGVGAGGGGRGGTGGAGGSGGGAKRVTAGLVLSNVAQLGKRHA